MLFLRSPDGLEAWATAFSTALAISFASSGWLALMESSSVLSDSTMASSFDFWLASKPGEAPIVCVTLVMTPLHDQVCSLNSL